MYMSDSVCSRVCGGLVINIHAVIKVSHIDVLLTFTPISVI